MDPKVQEGLVRPGAMFGVLALGAVLAVRVNSLWILVAAVVAALVVPRIVAARRGRRRGE